LKSLLLLWSKIADESAIRCCTSAALDFKKVQCRFEHEGLSFLTITLPNFGKDFELSLDQGMVDRKLFQGFTWKAGLPLFLGGFLDRVFDRNSGVLLDEPCIDAILAIRQLTLMFGKLSVPCSDRRVRKAIRGFVESEKEVRDGDAKRESSDLDDFRRVSHLLFGDVFQSINRRIAGGEAIPKHGPGATADRFSGNRKFNQRTWTTRLEEVFPAWENLIPNCWYLPALDDVDFLEPGQELPVRVITVPKTLKTPRIIAIEPVAMQYMQQAILQLIVSAIEGKTILNRMIGFRDQTRNQRMARDGSLIGNLATIDLSEASDRVSNQLVREMTRNYPHLHRAVDATRSRKADVPGHGVLRLAKFASMGSALCFPFEAMVFTTIIFLGIERELNTRLTDKAIQRLSRRVRVYGDDIIVPVDYVQAVVSELEHFGALVNRRKSFWNGKFRESCGKEYFNGEDVSIVRVRDLFPTRRQRVAEQVISIVSLRNQLYFAGYWSTCQWLDEYIRGVLRYFPVVLSSSPALGRHSFLGYQPERLGPNLHDPQVKGWVEVSKSPPDHLEGYGALLKYFLKQGEEPFFDVKHLERAGRPRAVSIVPRWVSAV